MFETIDMHSNFTYLNSTVWGMNLGSQTHTWQKICNGLAPNNVELVKFAALCDDEIVEILNLRNFAKTSAAFLLA
jgi:hypothetical protein